MCAEGLTASGMQACYIMCSERCKAYVDNEPDVFDGESIAAAAASKKRART